MDRGASRQYRNPEFRQWKPLREPGEEQHCTHRDCRIAGWMKFRANHCIYFTIRQKLALCIVTQYMFPMRFQIFGLFFCILALHSQTPLGTVSGLAVDASGGAVTAASVTLTNNDTGVRRTAATNSSGAYAFPDLPPGTYRLGADAKGFRPIETRAFRRRSLPNRAPGPEIRSGVRLHGSRRDGSRVGSGAARVARRGQQPGAATDHRDCPPTCAASPRTRVIRA